MPVTKSEAAELRNTAIPAKSPVAVEGLERTGIGIREWIGLAAYRVTGKIDDLLPGPVRNQKQRS